jgi:hypothetical protein
MPEASDGRVCSLIRMSDPLPPRLARRRRTEAVGDFASLKTTVERPVLKENIV